MLGSSNTKTEETRYSRLPLSPSREQNAFANISHLSCPPFEIQRHVGEKKTTITWWETARNTGSENLYTKKARHNLYVTKRRYFIWGRPPVITDLAIRYVDTQAGRPVMIFTCCPHDSSSGGGGFEQLMLSTYWSLGNQGPIYVYCDKRHALSICRSSQVDLSHLFVTAVLPWESNITAHSLSSFLFPLLLWRLSSGSGPPAERVPGQGSDQHWRVNSESLIICFRNADIHRFHVFQIREWCRR